MFAFTSYLLDICTVCHVHRYFGQVWPSEYGTHLPWYFIFQVCLHTCALSTYIIYTYIHTYIHTYVHTYYNTRHILTIHTLLYIYIYICYNIAFILCRLFPRYPRHQTLHRPSRARRIYWWWR